MYKVILKQNSNRRLSSPVYYGLTIKKDGRQIFHESSVEPHNQVWLRKNFKDAINWIISNIPECEEDATIHTGQFTQLPNILQVLINE